MKEAPPRSWWKGLFGKYVIPRFKNPRSIVRTSDAILADIRAARPAHYAEREAFVWHLRPERALRIAFQEDDHSAIPEARVPDIVLPIGDRCLNAKCAANIARQIRGLWVAGKIENRYASIHRIVLGLAPAEVAEPDETVRVYRHTEAAAQESASEER